MLQTIELDGFRNYAALRAEFSPRVNIIEGRNAQGKTNLLEAVYLLASGRSHRAARDREMINFSRETAVVRGTVAADGRAVTHEARLSRSQRRVNLRDGVKLARYADFSGTLSAVMFTPDDLELVRGGAEARRKLLDQCIAQLRPRYSRTLSEFARLYAHKSRILRDWRDNPSLLAALPEFNDGLIDAGSRLIYYRAAFMLKLRERAKEIHRDCSGGSEELTLDYETVPGADVAQPDRSVIIIALRDKQARMYDAETASGRCLFGAQKDDITVLINGAPARMFASQGQARTAALAMKLAERDIMCHDTGSPPVLLLDDVLSELDDTRRAFVLERATDGQVFITRCDGGGGPHGGAKIFTVENGAVI